MAPASDANFAGQLRRRLGASSCLLDAATGRQITGETLSNRIAAQGQSFLAAGLQPGDRLLIGCTLSPSCGIAYLGAMHAGLVAVPLEERTLQSDPAAWVEAVGAAAIWTESAFIGKALDSTILRLNGDAPCDPAFAPAPAIPVKQSELAALMSTSGSAGKPRFVKISHGNLTANTEAITRSQHLTAQDRAMLVLPLSYCFGASVLQTHLWAGGSVVLDRRFMFPDKVLRAVAEHGCTTFAGVPTVYNVLLNRSKIRDLPLPSLRRFLQAGGHLPPEKINELQAILPEAKIYVMYGQTEATARLACLPPECRRGKQGSVGRPLDNVTIRIADENGEPTPAGAIGILWASGPSISSGYWNNPAETARVFRGGWLCTGDLVRQDEDGFLWVEGRQGSFVKMRGMRVSFAEVESAVATLDGVFECAMRSVPHPEAGEALQLFIVPNPGVELQAAELRRRLPAHWAVDSIHLIAELPKTSSGKTKLAELAVPDPCLHANA